MANQQSHHDKPSPNDLSPLETDVLEEYERLAANMSQLATTLSHLSSAPPSQILDSLRQLERKTSLVFTLLKASVYSIVLQQEIWGGGGPSGGGAAGQELHGHGSGSGSVFGMSGRESADEGEGEDEGRAAFRGRSESEGEEV